MARIFHIGVLVQDVEAAMEELTRALGLSWSAVREVSFDGRRLRTTLSIEGPPHLELLEGDAGGPWDASQGPRLDHIAYYTSDLAGDSRDLAEHGAPVDEQVADALRTTGHPVAYHRLTHAGMRVELADVALRADLVERVGSSPDLYDVR